MTDCKLPLIPKLRFPEFRDTAGWERKAAGTLFANRNEEGAEGLPIYSVTMSDGMVKRSTFDRDFYDIAEPAGNKKARKSDIAYNMMRMWQGAFGVAPEDCMVSPAYVVLAPQKDVHSDFFGFLFKLPEYLRLLTSHSQGLTKDRLRLYYKDFARIPSCCPGPQEQAKVAAFLTSVDELIVAEARKMDALKTHKKGLMQQLFPIKGETQPRSRFPEFQEAADWSSDSLGSLFETSSGGTPDRTKMEYWGGNIPWITTSLVAFDTIAEADEFITEEGLQNSSAKIFPEKTILMAMYGQGKTRGQVAMLGIEAACNQACTAILPRADIDPRFVFLNLSSRYEELRGLSNSGGQENLSQSLIQTLQFSYPKDEDEQKKIADCLTFLDGLIAAQTQKLEVLKTHKKGLMQQLFPSMQDA